LKNPMPIEKRVEKIKKSISKLFGNEEALAEILKYVEGSIVGAKMAKPWMKRLEKEASKPSAWDGLRSRYQPA